MTRSRSLFAALLIAGTVMTLTPSLSSAQYGGVYGGGPRWGVGTGYYGNYSGPAYGGYYGSTYPGYGYNGLYSPNYRYSNYGYYSPGYSLNWNSYPSWGYYSAYTPNYYSSDTGVNYSSPSNLSYYGGQGMQYGSSDSSGGTNYRYGNLSSDMQNRAFLNVRLPSPDAEVWIEGDKTRSMGTWREYMSPPLDPDKRYSYEIKARWMENGKEVTRTKKVSVRLNAPTVVDFTADRGDTDRDRGSGTDKDRNSGTEKDRTPGTDKDRTPDKKSSNPPDPDK